MPGTRQHYLPAALIGGFGRRANSAGLREAVVLWRRREWSTPVATRAGNIGFVNALYRLNNPAPGTDPDRVDQTWDLVEPYLPDSIARLARRRQTTDDYQVLVNYVATAGVRHPGFEPAVNRWLIEQRESPVSGDQLQLVRVRSLAEALLYVRGLRWRVLHSPKQAHRFILNDRGWTYFGQEDRPGRGLFVPLNGRVALLAWYTGSSSGGFDHQVVRPSWVKWLNAVTWSEAPQFVVGSPDDTAMLTQLRTPDEIGPALNGLGPYQGSDALMFDDI